MIGLLLAVAVVSVITFILYHVYDRDYWKRRGVTGPEPAMFFGNMMDLVKREHPNGLQVREWTKKYGPVYGIQEGKRRTLVISDPGLLNELFVKQFDNFYARRVNSLAPTDTENEPRLHVFVAEGVRWKRLRSIASTAFSSGNMKKILPMVEETVLEFLNLVDKHVDGDGFDIHPFYQEFTFDVISRIAMGQKESKMFNNPGSKWAAEVFGRDLRNPIVYMSLIFPSLQPLARKLFLSSKNTTALGIMSLQGQIEKAVHARIEEREEDARNGIEAGEPTDFIDLFIDARADVEFDNGAEFKKTGASVQKQMTTEEIIAQCFVFLLAGYDTTSNALAFASHLLATNPEKMKKLQEEIDTYCTEEKISYESLNNLRYMDCVIKETLRLYPLASIANSRRCVNTTKLGDVLVEKDTFVLADTWSLHFDKTIWGEDAEEFIPERWESNTARAATSWIPFGAGPRLCIGMRLANMEQKVILAHLLRRYDLTVGPKTEKHLNLVGSTTINPESVTIYLKNRS